MVVIYLSKIYPDSYQCWDRGRSEVLSCGETCLVSSLPFKVDFINDTALDSQRRSPLEIPVDKENSECLSGIPSSLLRSGTNSVGVFLTTPSLELLRFAEPHPTNAVLRASVKSLPSSPHGTQGVRQNI